MCQSSCGWLYKEGKPLKDITCPCGLGYWDIFKERFISGDQIREGAPSKDEYEAEVKATLKEGEFESRLREQWIHHFFRCPTKLALDQKAIQEGTGDTSSRLKAEAELEEIARGDFKSRGRSRSIHERRRGLIKHEEGMSRYRAASQGTSHDQRSRTIALTPNDSTLPATVGGDNRHIPRSDDYALFDKYRPTESVTSGYDEESSVWSVASQGPSDRLLQYFLPGEGIRQDVLEHHASSWKNTFGTGATVQPYTNADGRRGYIIRATKRPTIEIIRQLKKESISVEGAMRHKAQLDQRGSVDAGQRGERTRPGLAAARRDSQPIGCSTDEPARDTQVVRIASGRDRQTTYRRQNDRAQPSGLATARSDSRPIGYSVDDLARDTQGARIASDRGGRTTHHLQSDRAQRSVIESPPPIIERPSRHGAEGASSERETYPREPADVPDYSTTGRQDTPVLPRGDSRYRGESGYVVVGGRHSRLEPREVSYQQRDGRHEPRDTRIDADTRGQPTTESPWDEQDGRQDRRISRRDTRRDSRPIVDQESGDSLPQRRRDSSRH